MASPWIPDLQRTVLLVVRVDGEVDFVDDYPWEGDVYEKMEHEDAVEHFADRLVDAVCNVDGVTGVAISWETRFGTRSRVAGLEPYDG